MTNLSRVKVYWNKLFNFFLFWNKYWKSLEKYSSARTYKEIYPKDFCFDPHLGLNPHWKTKFSVKVAMIHDQLQVMSGEKKPSEVIEIFNSQVS